MENSGSVAERGPTSADAPPSPRPSLIPPKTNVVGGTGRIDQALGLGSEAQIRVVAGDIAAPPTASAPRDSDPENPAAGLRQDRYRILGEIARGGMGAVVRAEDVDLGRDVAMKVILGNPDRESVIRFLREARVAGQLEHPGIAPVHELGVSADGRAFFTMKLVRGESLETLIQEVHDDLLAGRGDDRFPLVARLEVFKKVCDAVGFAHSRHVVHRDLKPANIMVGEFGELQVMDWGLAKVIAPATAMPSGRQPVPSGRMPKIRRRPIAPDPARVADSGGDGSASASDSGDATPLTIEGDVMGTPQYMAPEQVAGDIDRIDARSDIFSLGAILYELLTLRRAFPAETIYQVMYDVAHGKVVPPAKRLANDRELRKTPLRVAVELDAIVMKALQVRRGARYRTAHELKAEIERFEAGNLVGAVTYSIGSLITRWMRTHRRSLAVALLVVLVAVGVVVGVAEARRQARTDEIARQLEPHRLMLDDAQSCVAALQSAFDAGQLDAVIADSATVPDRFAEGLQQLIGDDLVSQQHPEWVQQAQAVAPAIADLRLSALRMAARTELDALGDPHTAGADVPARAEASFQRFAGYLHEPGGHQIPIAAFPLWLARYHRIAPDTSRRWIAEAWVCQPGSAAATEAIWLLADHAGPEAAAVQLHAALSALESSPQPDERARAGTLARLVQHLGPLGPHAMTPFDTDVPARVMALRCLMRVLKPDGTLRDRVAAAFADDPAAGDALRADLADWLHLFRRTGIVAPDAFFFFGRGPALDRRYYQVDEPAREVRLYRARQPDEPGTDPAIYEPDGTIQLADVTGEFAPGVDIAGWGFHPPLPDGRFPVVRVHTPRHDRRMFVAVLESVDNPRVVAHTIIPALPLAGRETIKVWLVADLDNDGRQDLLILDQDGHSAISVVRVAYQNADGGFTPAEFLMPRADIGSLVEYARVADLDGDGANELLLTRREWNHFSFEIYRAGPSRTLPMPRVARAFIGPRAFHVYGTGPDHRILICTDVGNDEHRRFFPRTGRPMPFWGVSTWHFDGSALRMVDDGPKFGPLPQDPDFVRDNGFRYMHGPFDLPGGEQAFAIGGFERASRWVIADGQLPHASVRRTIFMRPDVPLPGGSDGQMVASGDHPVRPLRDVDLEVCATQSLLLVPPDTIDPGLARARSLLEFGLPEHAASVASRSLAATGTRWEARLELRRLQLTALMEAGSPDQLVAALDSTPVDRDLVPVIRDALGVLTGRARRHVDALRIGRRWESDASLGLQQRERLRLDMRRIHPGVALLTDPPALMLRGHTLSGTTLTEPVTGAADRMVSTTPWFVRLPDAPGDPLHLRTHRLPVQLVVNEVSDEATIRSAPDQSGVPLWFAGGNVRLLIEIRPRVVPTNSRLAIGLFPLADPDESTGEQWLAATFQGLGSNDLFTFRIGSRDECDADETIDRWLVVELMYDEGTHARRTIVADRDTGEVLYHAFRTSSPPAGGRFLFGFTSWGGTDLPQAIAEYDVGRVALWGDVRLLDRDAPVVEKWLRAAGVSRVNEAWHARTNGRPEDAANCLRQQADRMAAARTPDPAAASRYVAAHRFDAELALGLDGLDGRLAALMRRDPGTSMWLLDWLCRLPQRVPDIDALWDRVGRAAARLIADGNPDNRRPQLIRYAAERMAANQLNDSLLLPLVWWLHRQEPDSWHVTAMYADVLQFWVGRQMPDHAVNDVAGYRLCQLVETHAARLAQPTVFAAMFAHARALSRDSAFRLHRYITDHEPSVEEFVRLLREHDADRKRQIDRSRRAAARVPIPPIQLPN